MQHNYFANIYAYEAYETLAEAERTSFTHKEQAFVLEFLADTLASLTSINAECVVDKDEDYVIRYTDALEVLDNLQMLYSKLDADTTVCNFTLADAAVALCSYDTEYRESICEQFEDATDDRAKLQKAQCENDCNFATLACRIFNNY